MVLCGYVFSAWMFVGLPCMYYGWMIMWSFAALLQWWAYCVTHRGQVYFVEIME